MPRLSQVPASEDNPPIVRSMYRRLFGDRDPVAEPGTSTGTPGDWWTVFAHSPDILQHSVDGFGLYRSPDRKLDPVLRELSQTRAGYTAGSQFVFSQHCKSLRSLGCSDEKIQAVASWAASDLFSQTERLVLAYTDSIVYDRGRVPDGLFDALAEHFSDEEILELTYIASLYMQHAIMCRALRLEFDDVDEPITEVVVEGADNELRITER